MGPQELEAGDTFNSHPIDVNRVVRASFRLPEVHNELLGFPVVREQVIISAPLDQRLYLLPDGCLNQIFLNLTKYLHSFQKPTMRYLCLNVTKYHR